MHDDELTAAIREVRERVRARHPQGSLGLNGVAATDLTPLVHARDAAEAKVAAIGTVNPRRGGLKNSIIQFFKKAIARALDWHVREQIEFNRGVMQCVQATIEALAENNRALAALAAQHKTFAAEAEELKDIRRHWAEWRVGFEERRSLSEIHMLRTIAELQHAFQHRVTMLEQNAREMGRQQHTAFGAALERNTLDVQKRLWADLEEIRRQYERLIHAELKLIRQKADAGAFGAAAGQHGSRANAGPDIAPDIDPDIAPNIAPDVAPNIAPDVAPDIAPKVAPRVAPRMASNIAIDWLRFGEAFRGSQERIREHQKRYVARFAGAGEVLDAGCGRGEFLEAARDAGLRAHGIDQSAECVAICRSKGLEAERAELFGYLDALPDASLGGVYCSQVVEHLAPERLPDLINLLARKLDRGALLAIETPNPECLAIFATHFYLDPTHTRPIPPALLGFYLEEAGFVNIEIERLAPAVESIPALAELPAGVRETLFGGLDYAIFGRK